MIQFDIPDMIISDRFTASFVYQIMKDIAMWACITKKKSISHAQYLDIVYSQYGTLYDSFPDGPPLGTSKALTTPFVDGILG